LDELLSVTPVAVDPGNNPEVENAVAGRYLPALDGVRAVAILAVIAYHLGYGWASGGYLGVDLFFVLSGFLITSLLVEERNNTGSVRLGSFWGRRARRLLPALLVMLALLSIWVAISPGTTDLSQLRGDGLATIFYFANWHQLFAHQTYFTQFEAPSPLQHTWSLAIEEQFYLVWPFVVLVLLRIGRSRKSEAGGLHAQRIEPWRRAGIAATIGGSALSAAWMAFLWHSGSGLDRVYYGTDTRAFDLLAGASAAMFACSRPQPSRRVRSALHLASPLCLVVLVVVFVYGRTSASSLPAFMFYGGFALFAIAAAVLVSDVRQSHQGPVARALSLRPLRWIGRISYGLYLWHWPVIVELNSQRTGFSGISLATLQIGVTFVVATLSFYLLEMPIRRMGLSRLAKPAKAVLAPAGMALTAVAVLLATVPAAAAPSERIVVSAHTPGAGHISSKRSVQRPISLPFGVPSRSDPLSIALFGDSVMETQAPAIKAAFDSTGQARVYSDAIAGWGLTIAKNWSTEVPIFIRERKPELVVAMWSWDNGCLLEPRSPGGCTLDPTQYKALLERFIRIVLSPGNGVAGLIFEQYPPLGPLYAANQQQRDAGEDAWDALVSSMSAVFPGRVMYLPLAPAVELNGKFSPWLPPETDPGASEETWVRVRMLDNTHFCPAGAARYAAALLSDLTMLYRLGPPSADWSTAGWTHDPGLYNDPAGSCPDDHP
jgi:peptidoglycan/LPS O-acetylase OafA/YrhL